MAEDTMQVYAFKNWKKKIEYNSWLGSLTEWGSSTEFAVLFSFFFDIFPFFGSIVFFLLLCWEWAESPDMASNTYL